MEPHVLDPTDFWHFRLNILTRKGIHLSSSTVAKNRMLILQYTLGNLMVNDSGVYVCVARNPVGLREHNFTLVVQGE